MGEAGWLLAVALATGLLTCLTTRLLIPILAHREILDCPNERSSHQVPTPRGGGIAVIGSTLLAWAVFARTESIPSGVFGIVLGAVLLAAVSWFDDLRGLSPAVRLLAQAAAVAIGILVLPGPRDLFYLAAIGLVWIWWINLFNFMDGIDGLAGTEAAAIGAGLLLFAGVGAGADPALRTLAAAVTGAAIGFLVWNWSPARIFLGDIGSVPLGYVLGFLLLDLAARGRWTIAVILPLYFLADATITLVRRLLRDARRADRNAPDEPARRARRGASGGRG